MSRMFKIDGKVMRTWNPFTGCLFDCSYCWARKLAETKLKESYPNGFVPTFHPERLKVKFHPGEMVFVSDMGDIAHATPSEIYQINCIIEANPQTDFLIMTKAPVIYSCSIHWSANVIQGTTIETHMWNGFSKAPSPATRYRNIKDSKHPRKLISIEPVMDFDLDVFTSWLLDINPWLVQIGADNYHHNLPEPSWDKVQALISNLEQAGIRVEQKGGLSRLKGKE